MKKEVALLVVSVTVGLLADYATVSGMKVDFEAEDGTYTGLLRTHPDGKKTVYLDVNDHVTNTFRIHSNCSIAVADIVYFNDGRSDKVNVTLDENKVGFFMTEFPEVEHPPGNLWNILRNSRAVGRPTSVQQKPVHLVTVIVNETDCRGVEIDKITLQLVCGQDPLIEGGIVQQSGSGLSTGEIIGIVSAVLAVPGTIVAVGSIVFCICKLCK